MCPVQKFGPQGSISFQNKDLKSATSTEASSVAANGSLELPKKQADQELHNAKGVHSAATRKDYADSIAKVNEDSLRELSFREKFIGKKASTQDSVDYRLKVGHQPVAAQLAKLALSSHNKSFKPQNKKIGQDRRGTDGLPMNIEITNVSGETESHILFYSINGELDLRSESKSKVLEMQKLPLELFNKKLSTKNRTDIKDLHKKIEGSNSYSTMAVPLSLCRTVRVQNEQGKVVSFDDILPHFFVSGKAITSQYKGGTCLSLSEDLCNKINQDIGLNAYVVAVNAPENVLTLWPSAVSVADEPNKHALALLEGDTHTNVVVPYLQNGVKMFMRIDTGTGPDGIIRDGLSEADYAQYKNEFIIESPGKLAALSAQCTYKLNIKDYKSSCIFGFDLLRGKMYLNRNAAQVVGSDESEAVFSFSHFDDISEVTTESIMAAEKYLRAVAHLFKLPLSFVEDTMYLIVNRSIYIESVLIPPGKAMTECIGMRDKAVPIFYDTNKVGKELMPAEEWQNVNSLARLHIQNAAAAIEGGNGELAAMNYQLAIESLDDARVKVLEKFSSPDKKILDSMRYIDTGALVRFLANDVDVVCKKIADAYAKFPDEVNLALKHLGIDVLEKSRDYNSAINKAIKELLGSKIETSDLF